MSQFRDQFAQMFAQYDQLASQIRATKPEEVMNDPVKLQWAQQEGYKPTFNPNSNSVSWVPVAKPVYQQSQLHNLQGSMSPERLVESYPAFAWKAKNADPYITEVIRQAASGEITAQRAKEILYQFALETFKEARKEGKATGSAKTAVTFAEALESASTNNKAAG
ncbi:hypothetical protein [Pluralibacter sp.]|uniref:hypothetical protein n=1 Tax=Pluralibacter sp. TaxID=1920032 RepID=UPI0025E4A62C|nr:hypothetical protein [Pluralibacter sp.]MBV8042375.1 hypothetical protein [Pluralibacter sp.]